MTVLLVDGELGADDWDRVLVAEEVVDKIVNGTRLVLVGEGAAVDWVKSSEIVMRITIPQNYNPSAYLSSFWQEIDQSCH